MELLGSYFLRVFNLSESSWRVHLLDRLLSFESPAVPLDKPLSAALFHLGASLNLDPPLPSTSTLLFSKSYPSQPPLSLLHSARPPIPLSSSPRFTPVSFCSGPFACMFQAHLSMPSFLLLVCHPHHLLHIVVCFFLELTWSLFCPLGQPV